MRKSSPMLPQVSASDYHLDPLHRLLAQDEARDLLRRAQEYEEHALTRIYNLFADRVFRFIYYRVQDRNHAQDLTNEVFVRFLENISRFRTGRGDAALALTGWIFTIARNLIIDDYRRNKARPAESLELEAEEVEDASFDLDLRLTRADLQQALSGLTEEQQTVLLLRFDEGFTSAHVAQIMGKTEMAIKALQRRGLASMARLLGSDPRMAHAQRED